MAKLVRFFYILILASASFIILPLNLAEDVIDLKKVLGSWQVQKLLKNRLQ